MRKQRLDTLLAERGLFASRTRAAASVMAGEVCVGPGRRRAEKPGELVAADCELSVAERARYVSRGGTKLENALAGTGVAVAGRLGLDVGSSTGGFTDCLLQHGAAEVLAVDVGYGELAYSLRVDPRVRVLERTNARHLTPELVRGVITRSDGGEAARGSDEAARSSGEAVHGSSEAVYGSSEAVYGSSEAVYGSSEAAHGSGDARSVPVASMSALPDLAVVDVSFISLTKILPAVLGCLQDSCDVLALVKPQFEVGRQRVGRGGVVREAADRRSALVAVGLAACDLGVSVRRYCSSGLPGPKGNRETFVWLAREEHASAPGEGRNAPGDGGNAPGQGGGDAPASGLPVPRAAATQSAPDLERMAREVEP